MTPTSISNPLRNLTSRAFISVVLAVTLATGLLMLPLLGVAANRLVLAVPAYGSQAIGTNLRYVGGFGSIALFILGVSTHRLPAAVALLSLWTALLLLTVGLSDGARDLVAGRPAATRISLAAGAWVALVALLIGIGLAVKACRLRDLGAVVLLMMGAGFILAGRTGLFDHLSIAVEFEARRSQVIEAVFEHLALSGGALALGTGLAVAMSLWRRGQGLVEVVVSGIQVVPAVALMGALVALASALLTAVPTLREIGFSALGTGPALVGIAAYLLLPLWRGLARSLDSSDGAVLDAAEALGLSPAQVLMRVRLLLGAPLLIGALRVAAVQSLGLATLGALVGAGGLGRIVFDGMAQFAPDLILLGALPIVALSLGAETGLRALEGRARARWAS